MLQGQALKFMMFKQANSVTVMRAGREFCILSISHGVQYLLCNVTFTVSAFPEIHNRFNELRSQMTKSA
jgi:hypothetical protein